MAEAIFSDREDRAGRFFWGAVGASLLAHAVLLAYLQLRPDRPPPVYNRPVELVMIDVPPPKPPPPPEEPKPEPPKAPPKIKVAVAPKPPPKPVEEAPPPPNETPPPEPTKPVPLVVGISMSSTTAAGGFAAPVGNTLYGKTADKAENPQDVKAYGAKKYVPVYQVDSQPQVLHEERIDPRDWPEEARRAGIEGTVTLSIVIDAEGKVTGAKVLNGPGYGLNEAARNAMLKFRFRPAIKGGEAVSTEMKYNYTFLLD